VYKGLMYGGSQLNAPVTMCMELYLLNWHSRAKIAKHYAS